MNLCFFFYYNYFSSAIIWLTVLSVSYKWWTFSFLYNMIDIFIWLYDWQFYKLHTQVTFRKHWASSVGHWVTHFSPMPVVLYSSLDESWKVLCTWNIGKTQSLYFISKRWCYPYSKTYQFYSSPYPYIYICFGLVWFYGISTIVGYLMTNLF